MLPFGGGVGNYRFHCKNGGEGTSVLGYSGHLPVDGAIVKRYLFREAQTFSNPEFLYIVQLLDFWKTKQNPNQQY